MHKLARSSRKGDMPALPLTVLLFFLVSNSQFYIEDKFNCMMIIIRKLHYPCNPIGKAATTSVRMDCYEKQLKQLETETEMKVKITLG